MVDDLSVMLTVWISRSAAQRRTDRTDSRPSRRPFGGVALGAQPALERVRAEVFLDDECRGPRRLEPREPAQQQFVERGLADADRRVRPDRVEQQIAGGTSSGCTARMFVMPLRRRSPGTERAAVRSRRSPTRSPRGAPRHGQCDRAGPATEVEQVAGGHERHSVRSSSDVPGRVGRGRRRLGRSAA